MLRLKLNHASKGDLNRDIAISLDADDMAAQIPI